MTELNTSVGIKLGIARIFLEEAQFRHRGDPVDVQADQKVPATQADITIDLRLSSDGKRAIVRLRVVSEAPEAVYFYSVSYLVLFTIEGTPPEGLQDRLLVTGATMAMPFVREMVANLSGRGRHGATWLAPIDFSEIVRKQNEAKQAGDLPLSTS